MVSICFKSLNKKTIVTLNKYVDYLNFSNIIYSERKFSKFYNLIVHYTGLNCEKFYSAISCLLSEFIISNYEEKILHRQLKLDFFYFSHEEQKEILTKSMEYLNQNERYSIKKQELENEINSYIKNNKSILIDGLVNFRISKYTKYLNKILENTVHDFVIHKEYIEYVDLLKCYINEKTPQEELVHLIYSNNEKTLVDGNHNLITTTSEKKYISDISFSENDFILNSILALSPKKIIIHSDTEENAFLQFLKSIFEDKCEFCCGCKFCSKYIKSVQKIP